MTGMALGGGRVSRRGSEGVGGNSSNLMNLLGGLNPPCQA